MQKVFLVYKRNRCNFILENLERLFKFEQFKYLIHSASSPQTFIKVKVYLCDNTIL